MDRVNARELSFADYLRPVWRFKYLVVLVVVAAASATYAYTRRETKVYQTAAEIYVGQSRLQQLVNPSTPQANAIADDANLVTTLQVARAVQAQQHLPYPPAALLGGVTASPATGSDFITISAQGSDPKLTAALANGFAHAYLSTTSSNLARSARSALNAIEKQLQNTPGGTTTTGATTTGATGNSGGPGSAIRQGLTDEVASLESAVVSPPSTGQLVRLAPVPGVPVSPHPSRNAIFAAAIALVLAIIVCYLVDRRDRRVRSLAEVDALFDIPMLATVPHVRRSQLKRQDPGVVPAGLREPARTLRVNLEIARERHAAKVIVVASALPSEGKSTIVRNLALTYRDAGARVAVVESDLRRPVLAAQFGLVLSPGLGEAIADHSEPNLQRVQGRVHANGGGGRLDVLVAGHASEDPTVVLTDARFRGLVRELPNAYDLVLIDTPPVLVVGDPLPLLSLADGVILVARGGTLTYPAAERLRQTLDRVARAGQVNLLGVVANDVVDEVSSYYKPYKGERREPSVSHTPAPREHSTP